MSKDFKPIKFEDLNLTAEEMEQIAAGARVFLAPDELDVPEEFTEAMDDFKNGRVEPMVTPRPKRDTV